MEDISVSVTTILKFVIETQGMDLNGLFHWYKTGQLAALHDEDYELSGSMSAGNFLTRSVTIKQSLYMYLGCIIL